MKRQWDQAALQDMVNRHQQILLLLNPQIHISVLVSRVCVDPGVAGASSVLPAASQLLTVVQAGQKRSLHRWG